MFNHAPPGYVCPFCLICAGRFEPPVISRQSDVVARTELAIALVSAHGWPRNPGHVLVMPTRHVENLYDLPTPDGAAVFELSRRLAVAMKRAYNCAGVSTRQHNEPAGGQDVWHYHVHVFPRWPGDASTDIRLTPPEEREAYAVKLRATLG
jgi:histidine triad (HIT) family protein